MKNNANHKSMKSFEKNELTRDSLEKLKGGYKKHHKKHRKRPKKDN